VLGATFIRWRDGSKNLRVDAEITNARYGILSGAYSDYAQGNNEDIKARLKTSFCGYPVALYWVTGVDLDIYAENVHRAAYLAGVSGGKVRVLWKNQYIADLAVLCTDAKTGASSLSGCSDLDIESHDLGSTVFQTSSACCGIANSRQTSAIIHENLSFKFSVTSTNSVSTNVGGFKCYSGTLPGGETYFWEPTTILRNIRVSGVIDRTGQTADSNSAGDIYWRSIDQTTHTATVSNIRFHDISIKPSSGTTRDCYFEASGLTDHVSFENVIIDSPVGLQLVTASGTRVAFNRCWISELVSGGTVDKLAFVDSVVPTVPDVFSANTGLSSVNSNLHGASMTLRMRQSVLTLSGASVTWTNAIPLGALVIGAIARIQTSITGASGYQLGIATDTDRWV
jgi:hypothetical protein